MGLNLQGDREERLQSSLAPSPPCLRPASGEASLAHEPILYCQYRPTGPWEQWGAFASVGD